MSNALSTAPLAQQSEIATRKESAKARSRLRAAHAAESVRDGRLRFVRLPEAVALTGLSKATIYRLAKSGCLPRPVKIGLRASGWPLHVLTDFIESRSVA